MNKKTVGFSGIFTLLISSMLYYYIQYSGYYFSEKKVSRILTELYLVKNYVNKQYDNDQQKAQLLKSYTQKVYKKYHTSEKQFKAYYQQLLHNKEKMIRIHKSMTNQINQQLDLLKKSANGTK